MQKTNEGARAAGGARREAEMLQRETEPLQRETELLRRWLNAADCVLVGAGAGLSTAAGLTYAGARFAQNFSDFASRYGFRDMYAGGFYPFPTAEEYWAYWSRMIACNRYDPPALPLYVALRSLLEGKDYFVITTNVDHCFQKAGFDKARLFYTQGDYGLFQCSVSCRLRTYDNEQAVRAMVREQSDLRVPSRLLPRCPVCGAPMVPNLRVDDTFVEDAGWHAACARYEAFVQAAEGKKLLLLELGVGMNTPGIIKFPFRRMAERNPAARYVCINREEQFAPAAIASRSLFLDADLGILFALCGKGPAPEAG